MTRHDKISWAVLVVAAVALIAVSVYATRVAGHKPNLLYWCDMVEISPDFTQEERELCRKYRAQRRM